MCQPRISQFIRARETDDSGRIVGPGLWKCGPSPEPPNRLFTDRPQGRRENFQQILPNQDSYGISTQPTEFA